MDRAGADGRLIDGRFELLEQLGGGGMGLVWRARDTALHREVVLKEVRPQDPAMAAADPAGARELRERVLREARALARLQHPNVVVIHHIVDTPEHPHPWLVMELVRGGSLADRLEHGPLGVPEAARIGRGVLAALRAAHAVGIQHRDVKPGNVLLRPDGTPVLADFGIAAIQDATALTATGALIGSPEYIAPERIRGLEGNPSSDLWSLGMLLYVAVEGSHPLRRSTTLATLAAVLDEPLPPPVRAGLLGPLLEALLAKDPAVRPDAEQLDRALAAAAGEGFAPSFVPPYPQSFAPPYGGGPVGPVGPAGPVATAYLGPVSGAQAHPAPVDRVPTGFQAPPAGQATTSGRGKVVGITGAVASVAVAAAVGAYLVWGDSGGDAKADGRKPSATSTTTATTSLADSPAAQPTAPATGPAGTPVAGPVAAAPSATAAAKTNLLTPDGVRRTIETIKPYASDGKVYELTVYPEYASARIPTAAGSKLYDTLDIRDGKVTRSPGGQIIGDDKLVDLTAYSWDVLPTVIKKAEDTLNVPHPTSRYLLIEPDMFDHTPAIKVYLSDDYGSGYLETDPKGSPKRSYPRES
ncbi:serine/threonine-protein kinase [Kitasatospora sp. NPDC097643]|uniref:serine/threonine-protein kinase n=1 Tax=Kitasatospora sp. NPDC097643 TaxID=3157230 RepID=UPI003329AB5B